MQRSIGVTLSAVFVFFGCAMCLLFAVLLAFTTQMAPAASALPLLRGALAFDIVLDLAFVAWGVASGIGLLQLQQWARISMLVFSGIMIFFCLIPMALFPFIPIPQPEAAPANLVFFIRVFLELFYGFFVALGAFWIYFFNRQNVKAQFKGTQAIEAAVPGAPALEAGPKTPIPVIVLAIFLLLGGCALPLTVFLHAPIFLLGYAANGSAGKITALLLAAANIGAGIGLLKLKTWGWALALLLQAFNIINVACFILVPGAPDRINNAMEQQYAAMGMSNMPPGFSTPLLMRVSFSFGLLMAIAFLWILLAYRKAFQAALVTAAI